MLRLFATVLIIVLISIIFTVALMNGLVWWHDFWDRRGYICKRCQRIEPPGKLNIRLATWRTKIGRLL